MFITFEGGDGVGKSTQVTAVASRFRECGRRPVCVREPGGTTLGEVVRTLLLHRVGDEHGQHVPVSDVSEMLLFAASRSQLIDEVIAPSLAQGDVVLCDRFADSTIAYQGFGRGVDRGLIAMAIDLATRGVRPQLTILLDVPVEESLSRRFGFGSPDLFERQEVAFHNRVRRGFLELSSAEPDRWLVVNGMLPVQEITDIIWRRLAGILALPTCQNLTNLALNSSSH